MWKNGGLILLLCISLLSPNLHAEVKHEGSAGTLTLQGNREAEFNPLNTTLVFMIDGEQFHKDVSGIYIYLDDKPLSVKPTLNSPQNLSIPVKLHDGINNINVEIPDSKQYHISGDYALASGSNTVTVNTVAEDGKPITNAAVELKWLQDERITANARTKNGRVVFNDLPSGDYAITAKADGNLFGSTVADTRTYNGAKAPNPLVTLELQGFRQPSTMDNNDFRKDKWGWNTDKACKDCVKIVPHQE